MNNVAILPCRGIGDGLLMMIAAEQLRQGGHEVMVVHPRLPELRDWFPHHQFTAEHFFSEDEWIVAENDNTDRIALLKMSYRSNLTIFYPTYSFRKHGPLTPKDRTFERDLSMAENIARSTASLLSLEKFSKDNGIVPPPGLTHRLHRQRVVIHPGSSTPMKNWLHEKYEEVARNLERRGYEPVFLPRFRSLSDLAAFIYESGFVIGNDSLLGHLASNLQIPTVIVADDPRRMALWRPGWLEGAVITLGDWVPEWRFFQRNWAHFISSGRVTRAFDRLSRGF
jgi:hypothetical protein